MTNNMAPSPEWTSAGSHCVRNLCDEYIQISKLQDWSLLFEDPSLADSNVTFDSFENVSD